MKKSLSFIDQRRTGATIFIMIMMVAMITTPAGANGGYQLEVTYTNGSVLSGPFSFGLSSLPTSVSATYTLGPGTPSTEPGEENDIYFDESDVVSASINFGDASWNDSSGLESFSMLSSSGTVYSLSYAFLPITTQLADGSIVLNFPLTITGTDKATGLSFEYQYTESTQTLTAITQILSVAIDIKPGSEPNCFNLNGNGVVPVAILGSMDFDVSQIDLASLSFGGLAVRVRGNKGALCAIDYSDADEYLDLICQFEDDAANWDAGDGEAALSGNLLDGIAFEGSDSICVVP